MKLAAVSQRVDVLEQREERRDGLDQRLAQFLLAAGCLTAPVPNGYAGAAALADWLARIRPDLVVLTGGGDIGRHPERDATERVLLEYAGSRPLLGICRGMQVLAEAGGAALRPLAGHIRSRHRLAGEIGGTVNSYHGLGLAACPPDYAVLARSEEGEIEAIGHLHRPWEGWMWHPEREAEFDPRDLQRLRELIR